MKRNGLSNKEVAKGCGVNVFKFTAYINNTKNKEGFSEKAIITVCRFLGIKLSVYVEFTEL